MRVGKGTDSDRIAFDITWLVSAIFSFLLFFFLLSIKLTWIILWLLKKPPHPFQHMHDGESIAAILRWYGIRKDNSPLERSLPNYAMIPRLTQSFWSWQSHSGCTAYIKGG